METKLRSIMPDPLGKRMTAAKSSGKRKPRHRHRGPARFPGCCLKRNRTKELARLRRSRTSNVSIRRAAWLQLRAAIRPTSTLRHGSITEQTTTSTFPSDDDPVYEAPGVIAFGRLPNNRVLVEV